MAGLALLGVLLHATLVPWHASARQAERSVLAELVADLGLLCHGGRGGDARAPDPQIPTDPSQDCPVCQGLGASKLAVVAEPGGLAVPRTAGVRLWTENSRPSPVLAVLEPRSRGPPQPC